LSDPPPVVFGKRGCNPLKANEAVARKKTKRLQEIVGEELRTELNREDGK
jgi:hypothetical protein